MVVDVSFSDTESNRKSFWAISLVCRNNLESAMSSSSSLSAYEREKTREAD